MVNYSLYLTELALPDYPLLRFPGSLIAAASVYVASLALGR